MKALKAKLFKKYPESELTLLGKKALKELRARHPKVPEDYVAFLAEIGWGSIGDSNYMLYNGFLEPDDFGWDSEMAKPILLFGDDFAGRHDGFYTAVKPWVVVTVDSAHPEDQAALKYHLKKGQSFSQFVEKFLLS